MALKKKTLTKIEQAIEHFVNYLRYKSVGPHILSKDQLKKLVMLGYINSKEVPRTAVIEAYTKTHDLALDDAPAPRVMRQGAVDFLERMFDGYSQKAGQQLKTDLMATIESHLMPLFDRREGQAIYEVLKDPKIHSKYVGNALRGVVKNWESRWKTIVGTELNRASNWGSMDAIITNNPEKQPDEIIVYKIGPYDGATCQYCKKFWFLEDGKTPRLYKMSELMANGSNIGRKAREWKPTIDSTHPNERHILHELKPGYGFVNGSLQYISKDHSEFTKQRKG